MRIAYLDCFAGISGDMFLGAMLDAGLPPQVLHEAISSLNLGATLRIERVDRSGITSTKVHVLEHGKITEAVAHEHSGQSLPGESPLLEDSLVEQQTSPRHQQQVKTQHLHKAGHDHGSDQAGHTHPAGEAGHGHAHGRSLPRIRDLIQASTIAEPVKNFAVKTFELLGASEAKIHNVPIEQIHFHEVGAVDAIVDIVAASVGIHFLGEQSRSETGAELRWHSSAVNVGGGMVRCAHGVFPVPAPATADLLRGMPTYSAHVQKELVTPTGAALLRALAPTFGTQPAMRVSAIGYGAGTRNPEHFPNVLRLSIGDAGSPLAGPLARSQQQPDVTPGEVSRDHSDSADTVTVIETALDDLNPQILAHVTEQALLLGALDVMTTAVGMKKGRPGTLITILTDGAHRPALERLLLRETSTLGLRVHEQSRVCLVRRYATVTTPFGEIRIKMGLFEGEVLNAAPEFEDCREAAVRCSVPVKEVLQAAIAAHVNSSTGPAGRREREDLPA